jgi:hypothetical protein
MTSSINYHLAWSRWRCYNTVAWLAKMFTIIYRDQFHDQRLTGFSDKTNNMAMASCSDVISINLRIKQDKVITIQEHRQHFGLNPFSIKPVFHRIVKTVNLGQKIHTRSLLEVFLSSWQRYPRRCLQS